jgi:hypothetical protein
VSNEREQKRKLERGGNERGEREREREREMKNIKDKKAF